MYNDRNSIVFWFFYYLKHPILPMDIYSSCQPYVRFQRFSFLFLFCGHCYWLDTLPGWMQFNLLTEIKLTNLLKQNRINIVKVKVTDIIYLFATLINTFFLALFTFLCFSSIPILMNGFVFKNVLNVDWQWFVKLFAMIFYVLIIS